MTRDEIVEVMARAIGRKDGIPDELWSASVPHATAALSALEAAGMRVVPEVPSEAMVIEGKWAANAVFSDDLIDTVYRAMLASQEDGK